MSEANRYNLTGRAAEMYERNMVSAIFAPFAQALLEIADIQPGETVLDVACGTGIVARLAAPKAAPGGRVVGLDFNAEMLDVARTVARDADIRWVEGSASAMPLADREFDVVLCQHGLQYFPDRPASLRDMRRVARDHGRLVLSVWRPIRFNRGHATFADVLQRRVGEAAAATRRAPFALSDADEVRALIEQAGFRGATMTLVVRVVRFASAEAMVRLMMAGTPLAAAMADTDRGVLQRVIDEVTSGLSDYVDDRGLAIPMESWIAAANSGPRVP
jgi:ubiquinone/menaquinone biosynthesis C-methylase UbiE